LTEHTSGGKTLVVEIQRAWSDGHLGVEVRLVLGRDGRVRTVEVEPRALERLHDLLNEPQYVKDGADFREVTPADGRAYLDAIFSNLSYRSRVWATEPFEMDEAAALTGVRVI
jgi:hypothetical protein